MLQGVRAVYFDLDDTLCAYWEAAKGGLAAAFEALRPAGVSTQAMLDAWAAAFRAFYPRLRELGLYEAYLKEGAVTRVELMRRTLELLGAADEPLAGALSARYASERNARLALFPEARAVLEALAPRFRMGVITNGPADVQREEIAILGLDEYFEHVFIEGEMGFGKPEAEVFARAAAAIGSPPSELLFVGNSYRQDVRPALEAGWRAIWIRRASDVPPSGVEPESRPAGSPEPTLEIGSLTELLQPLGLA